MLVPCHLYCTACTHSLKFCVETQGLTTELYIGPDHLSLTTTKMVNQNTGKLRKRSLLYRDFKLEYGVISFIILLQRSKLSNVQRDQTHPAKASISNSNRRWMARNWPSARNRETILLLSSITSSRKRNAWKLTRQRNRWYSWLSNDSVNRWENGLRNIAPCCRMLARATVWYHDGLASRGGLSCHLDITLYQQWQFEHQSRINMDWKYELLSCRTTLTTTPWWKQPVSAYKTNLCGMKITSFIRVFVCQETHCIRIYSKATTHHVPTFPHVVKRTWKGFILLCLLRPTRGSALTMVTSLARAAIKCSVSYIPEKPLKWKKCSH